MAKVSTIEKNNRRRAMSAKFAAKRAKLLAVARSKTAAPEDRFAAQAKLTKLPRNANPTRIRNRCEITGRPRAVYRKFRLSRIMLRELGSQGLIPGLVKSSW